MHRTKNVKINKYKIKFTVKMKKENKKIKRYTNKE